MKDFMQAAVDKLETNGLDPHMIGVSIITDMAVDGWLNLNEPEDAISFYFANIELRTGEDYETRENIGKATLYYLRGVDWASDRVVDLRDMADSLNGDLLAAVEPILDEKGQITTDFMGLDVVYVDDFYISPAYRNKGIGSLVFPMLLDVVGSNAAAITVIPTPFDDSGENMLEVDDLQYGLIYNGQCKFLMKYGFYRADHNNRIWVKNTQFIE